MSICLKRTLGFAYIFSFSIFFVNANFAEIVNDTFIIARRPKPLRPHVAWRVTKIKSSEQLQNVSC